MRCALGRESVLYSRQRCEVHRVRYAALLIACCYVCGCVRVSGTGAGRHPWTQANVLRVGVTSQPNTLNPLLWTLAVESFLFGFSFDPLLTFDQRGRAIPVLAQVVPSTENGGISKDGLTITYHLRRNVRWQDGVPLTSRDVAYTFEATMNPANNVTDRTGYDLVQRVDTPDAYTIVFHLKRRFSPILNDLFSGGAGTGPGYVLPQHLLGKFASLNNVSFNAKPVGSGPFKVLVWRRGDSIEYVANPNYFRGKPKLSRIIVRLIPDENTAVTALQAHEIDVLYLASAAVYPRLQSLEASGVTTVLSPAYKWIAVVLNTSKAPLNDVRVRQAFAYGIDKPFLVQRIMHGSASVATEDIPSFFWAYDPEVPRYSYEPRRAQSLLQAARWSQDSRLNLIFDSSDATHRAMSAQIQSQLAKLGVSVELTGYTENVVYATNGPMFTGKFDLALETQILGADPDNGFGMRCSAIPPGGYNLPRYCNPKMDGAEDAAVGTFDRTKRKAAYAQIETLLARDVPYIFIAWPKNIYGVNSDLRGFAPGQASESWNAYEWSI